jgi:hypothetical protein
MTPHTSIPSVFVERKTPAERFRVRLETTGAIDSLVREANLIAKVFGNWYTGPYQPLARGELRALHQDYVCREFAIRSVFRVTDPFYMATSITPALADEPFLVHERGEGIAATNLFVEPKTYEWYAHFEELARLAFEVNKRVTIDKIPIGGYGL